MKLKIFFLATIAIAMMAATSVHNNTGVAEHKSFSKPEETREFPLGKVELVKLNGATLARATFQPGWRWSTSLKETANTKSCEAPHFQYHLSGTLRILMDDGTTFDCKAGDLSSLPMGHDAWVIGKEPVVVIDFQGMVDYASQKGH